MSEVIGTERGNVGEEIATAWLKNKGYKIIERNHRRSWGEIDIIASKGGTIHFVEVKTAERPREANDPFSPLSRVGPQKRHRFARVIQTYLLEKHIPEEMLWRADVIAVYLDTSHAVAQVEMFEDVLLGA